MTIDESINPQFYHQRAGDYAKQQELFFAFFLDGTEGDVELRAMSWNRAKIPRAEYENSRGICSRDMSELIEFASNEPGDVFMGVNTRKPGIVNASKNDICEVDCIAVDFDFKHTPLEKLERAVDTISFKPTMIINSGNGRHLYWMISPMRCTDETQALCEATGKALAARLGGDNCYDITRVLRVPGRANSKYDTLPVCRLMTHHGPRYALAELAIRFVDGGVSTITQKSRIKVTPVAKVPERFWSLLKEDQKIQATWDGNRTDLRDQSRSGFDQSMASILARRGFSPAQVAAVLREMPSGKGNTARPDYVNLTIAKAFASPEKAQVVSRTVSNQSDQSTLTRDERTIEPAFAGRSEHYEPRRDRMPHSSLSSVNSLNSQPPPSEQVHPIVDSTAFHGLAGEIVDAISPHSEADPVAILINILTAFGNVIGSEPHFFVEKSKHHLNLFVVQVGKSAKGRKGTAWSTPKFMLQAVDEDWGEKRIRSGLSSGEGLVNAVRDARYEKRPVREKNRVVDYESVLADDGEDDKRLLCVEEEFSQCLKVMHREGNILSPVLRDAWDGKKLAPITKGSPIEATGALISIIAHITRDELLRCFTSTEQTNGFGNRFIWLFVKRSKLIPTPIGCPDERLNPLIEKLRDAVSFARNVSAMQRDDEAEAIWGSVYYELSADRDGLVGALLARSEPQVMRLACIYALLDLSDTVQSAHLEAALALWAYSEQSAQFIFGDLKGDPGVDRAFEPLKHAGSLTTTAIHNLFGRHADKNEIDRVIRELLKIKYVVSETSNDTGGRPTLTLVWGAKQAK